MTLEPGLRRELLGLARASIEAALSAGRLAPYPQASRPAELLQLKSAFVTLHCNGTLRGCCGTIDARRTLAEEVWHSAWACAFRDPRFAPLTATEWRTAELQVSVLSPPEQLPVASERELIEALRPGVDGLILECGLARATFLPSVWQELTDPAQFVRRLKLKAGWQPDFWSAQLRASRYTSESFAE